MFAHTILFSDHYHYFATSSKGYSHFGSLESSKPLFSSLSLFKNVQAWVLLQWCCIFCIRKKISLQNKCDSIQSGLFQANVHRAAVWVHLFCSRTVRMDFAAWSRATTCLFSWASTLASPRILPWSDYWPSLPQNVDNDWKQPTFWSFRQNSVLTFHYGTFPDSLEPSACKADALPLSHSYLHLTTQFR